MTEEEGTVERDSGQFEESVNLSRKDEPRIIFRLSPGNLHAMINVEIDFGSCGPDGWSGTMVGAMAQRLIDTLKANMTTWNSDDQPPRGGH